MRYYKIQISKKVPKVPKIANYIRIYDDRKIQRYDEFAENNRSRDVFRVPMRCTGFFSSIPMARYNKANKNDEIL